MASIQQTKYGFRAQVKVGKVRESKCFQTEEAAVVWSQRRERELGFVNRMAKATVHAKREWANLLHGHKQITKEQILALSKPSEDVVGIYFLILEEEILYIGQSKSCYRRIDSHRRTKTFDRYTIVECYEEQLNHLEMMFIEKFAPILNKTSPITGVADKYQHKIISDMLGTG